MTGKARPRLFSIPPGAPFLPELAQALTTGRLIPGFSLADDPLALAAVTIYLPTRRAARALRSVFVERSGADAAILPTIRALGEFDEEAALMEAQLTLDAAVPPPVPALDRLLFLAPLIRLWKSRLPAHVATLFQESVVVPASTSDAIWFARDLAALMDEMETDEGDWSRLPGLVEGDLAGWWQVTLDFLAIVSAHWPRHLAAAGLSNPAAYRSAMIRAEADRLRRSPPAGPVIAAGSTGSIPATAELLSVVAGLPMGAVVLPGLDTVIDEESWASLAAEAAHPAVFGHPQFGLKKLLAAMNVAREAVEELAVTAPGLDLRRRLVSEAMRPADTTDAWADAATDAATDKQEWTQEALAGVSLVEAANERDEAIAIAVALRDAVDADARTAALVTGDRELARRVAAELLRFGVRADDSGGMPLARAPGAVLLALILDVVFRPGDPVALLALLKHPLLSLGRSRAAVRSAAETIDLVCLRGGTGRPDVAALADDFERRLAAFGKDRHPPFWLGRLHADDASVAIDTLRALSEALAPLLSFRDSGQARFADMVPATVEALESAARDAEGGVSELYRGNAGDKLAEFMRGLLGCAADLDLPPNEWPDVLRALVASEVVKPAPGAETRVSIWGALEARLQTVDTLVIGGLNEGSFPRRAAADSFMSRLMKNGVGLEPPERRIGLAAHDFCMAMGAEAVILTRAARSGDAPSVASRWLQRLLTRAGPAAEAQVRARGSRLLAWAHALDRGPDIAFAPRPNPAPALAARPSRFSVTEIETLRRDPYAIYARRILGLHPLDELIRDPGAAERGDIFHEALHRFSRTVPDPFVADALERLLAIGRALFDEAGLPPDVAAIWWPRFSAVAANVVDWEKERHALVARRYAELSSGRLAVADTGIVLSGRADRIDIMTDETAEIFDYKTGISPSKRQARTLLAPQLALEAALLERGAFEALGHPQAGELAYIRLKADGSVLQESILADGRNRLAPAELSGDAWRRLCELLTYYNDPANGYRSRALPFRESETSGDYDHLARVLEWSAGTDGAGSEGE